MQRSTAQRSAVQRSAAQCSAAQRSAAQCSCYDSPCHCISVCLCYICLVLCCDAPRAPQGVVCTELRAACAAPSRVGAAPRQCPTSRPRRPRWSRAGALAACATVRVSDGGRAVSVCSCVPLIVARRGWQRRVPHHSPPIPATDVVPPRSCRRLDVTCLVNATGSAAAPPAKIQPPSRFRARCSSLALRVALSGDQLLAAVASQPSASSWRNRRESERGSSRAEGISRRRKTLNLKNNNGVRQNKYNI